MKVEKKVIDLKTGEHQNFVADVQSNPDETHTIMSLTFEGYRTKWEPKP